MTDVMRTEVLVIGGGGAACRAALEAHRAGAKVLLVTKGDFGAIGTRGAGATAGAQSEWGLFSTPGWTGPATEVEKPFFSRFFPPPEQALENIREVGLGMADPKLARIMVEEAVEHRKTLINMGVSFGEWGIRGHGVTIMGALVTHVRGENVPFRQRIMITNLLVQDGECVGAVGVDEMTGETVVIEAASTIICTGGGANLFLLNLNPPDNTGDGYVMGYEAGAELMNLEFKQIFVGSVYPSMNSLFWILHPHVKLTNALGEEFLQKYLPKGVSSEECLAQRQNHNPFSTVDTLSRYFDIAIVREVEEGRGTKNFGVYLDRSDPRVPPITVQVDEYWKYRGVDFDKGPVEMNILHQASMGGLRINENAETAVPHLYAAGEVGSGTHGAGKIGGYTLLTSQVFGAKAGRNGAAYAKGRKQPGIDSKILRASEDRIKAVRDLKGHLKPMNVKKMLQESAYYNLMVIRSQARLTKLLDDVRGIREELIPNLYVGRPQELVEALELRNLLILAELEANVCLKRTESRGPHYREEFPEQDDKNWAKSIIVKKVADNLQLETMTLDPLWKWKDDKKLEAWG